MFLGTVYIISAITFLVLDALWLGLIAKPLYTTEMGGLMADDPNMIAAAVFYVLYIFGVLYFAIMPHMSGGSLTQVAISGALFGLIAYATYDLTGLAVIQNWSTKLAIIDIIWGAVVTCLSAVTGYWAAVKFVAP